MPPDPDELLSAWLSRGRRLEVFGRQIFAVDTGGSGRPVLLLVHGFPTASFDFHKVIDRFAEGFRVIAHDHVGFGFSDKPRDFSYSLLEQAEFAVELWRLLGVKGAHLLAHDYGTSVATELLARRERQLLAIEFESVTLANGSVHLDLAKLRLTQRVLKSPVLGPVLARLAGAGFFKRRLRQLWGDRSQVDERDLECLWLLLNTNGGRRVLPALSNYLNERVCFRYRWIGALERLDLPTHILWGQRDPVAVVAIARALAEEIPEAKLTWLEEAGHFPMLEDPKRWSDEALTFYRTLSVI